MRVMIPLYLSYNNTYIRIVPPTWISNNCSYSNYGDLFPKPLFFLFLTLPLASFSQCNFYVSLTPLTLTLFFFKIKPNSTILIIPLLQFPSLISLIFLKTLPKYHYLYYFIYYSIFLLILKMIKNFNHFVPFFITPTNIPNNATYHIYLPNNNKNHITSLKC